MSTILKALKKADASGDKKKAPFVRASLSQSKGRWMLLPIAVGAVLIGFAFAYIFRDTTPEVKLVEVMTPAPAADTAPAGAPGLNSRAIEHLRAGRYREAESLLRDALSRYPDDPYLHNHLGLALRKQGRPMEAVAEYERAVELKPDYHIAMNNLAVALEAAGDRDLAVEYYRKALAGDPSMSGAHLNYALLLESQGELGEAENHYHTFLTLSNDENLKGLVRRRLRAID